MVSDEIKNDLAELVEGTRWSLDWAVEQYEEELEFIRGNMAESASEEKKKQYAVSSVNSEVMKNSRSSRGEELELKVLALGHAGKRENFGQSDDTLVMSYGIIRGKIGEDDQQRSGKAVFMTRADDVDPYETMEKFHALNTLKAVYEVSESDDLDGVYQCWSCDATNLNETEIDALPQTRDEKNQMLRKVIPEASLATLTDDLSAYDPETGYTYDFGADIKRIEGRIVDHYIDNDGEWGRYTVMDDSVTADDIMDTDIVDDEQNTPGLTVWAEPDYHMEYGDKTRADFYGTIEEGSNGNLQMNLVGIVPIVPRPMDDDSEASSKAKKTTDSL